MKDYDSYKYQSKYRQSPRGRYTQHKINAKQRGIEFTLTYDEWWKIWEESGKWDLRGCKVGCYVMARKGDAGPYSKDNVLILSFYRNFIDGQQNITRKHTAKTLTVTFAE